VSLQAAAKIAKALDLNSTETKHLILLCQKEKGTKLDLDFVLDDQNFQIEQISLQEDGAQFVSQWYHSAILNLMDCEEFYWDARWISRRLNITVTQAMLAMENLLRWKLVFEGNGKLVASKEMVVFENGIPSSAVKTYHREMLRKAIDAIDLQSTDEREIVSLGLAFDPREMRSIKQDISEFADRIFAKYGKKLKNRKKLTVYQLQLAFFKLSQGDKNEAK
jgi:uncharacterized protein (TIGR02147 family)